MLCPISDVRERVDRFTTLSLMATATFQPRTKQARAWVPIAVGFSVISLIVLIFAGIAFFFLEYLGRDVQGYEIDPSTFSVRRYEYRVGILSGNQRGGLQRIDESDSVLVHTLVAKNFLPSGSPSRWDLAMHDEMETDANAVALPLHILLRSYSFNQFWTTWTTNHPNASKVVWPAVVELANQERYGDIAPLLEKFQFRLPRRPTADTDAYMQNVYTQAIAMNPNHPRVAEWRQLAAQPFSQRNPHNVSESEQEFDSEREPAADSEQDPVPTDDSGAVILERSLQSSPNTKPLDLSGPAPK